MKTSLVNVELLARLPPFTPDVTVPNKDKDELLSPAV